jgi:type IV pilus assembly protein PilA
MTHSPKKKPISGTEKVLIGTGIGCGCLTFLGIPLAILIAIALPSFLIQADKAKEREAESYISTIVRSEQAYFTEHNQFAPTIAALALPDSGKDSIYYSYNLKILKDKTQSMATVQATPKAQSQLRTFIGAARAVGKPEDAVTEGLVCANERYAPAAAPFVLLGTKAPLACPPSMIDVSTNTSETP